MNLGEGSVGGDICNPHSGVDARFLDLGLIGLADERSQFQCDQVGINDQNTYRLLRLLSLLTIAGMNDLTLGVFGTVSLLLADELLVDLESQARLAGIVGEQPSAKRQRANTCMTYRFDPSLQDGIEQELATILGLK